MGAASLDGSGHLDHSGADQGLSELEAPGVLVDVVAQVRLALVFLAVSYGAHPLAPHPRRAMTPPRSRP
jgi:hypothetical protein